MKSLKNWAGLTCIFYTATSIFLILLNLVLNSTALASGIRVTSFLLLLPGAGVFALAWMSRERIFGIAGALLRYGMTVGSLLIFLYLPSAGEKNFSSGLTMWAFFTVVYWIVFLLTKLLKKKRKQKI